MAHEVKDLMLKELEEKFRDIRQTGCVLVDYQGLKADKARRLRRDALAQGAEMTVVKNTIFGLAVEHLGAGELRALLQGPIAVVRAEDAIAAARAVEQMAKADGAIAVRGGYADGKVLGPEGVQRLASIPSRDVLLSMVAGALMAPLRRLACALLARPRELLSVLEQLRDRAAPAPAATLEEPGEDAVASGED